MVPSHNDPIRARRARMGRLSRTGKRVGYSLWLAAVVTFALGMLTTLRPVITTIVVGGLVLGSALLAPSIVIAYGVRAADREERDY